MESIKEIAEKFSSAATDLINDYADEIQEVRGEHGGKITLRLSCVVHARTIKTKLTFGVPTKDEVEEQLDGDQKTLPGLDIKSKRKKQPATAEA